jgi:alkylhydroperoxidase family enzyme
VLLDGFDDRSEPPPADPNGAEDAGRTLAEPLRQAEGDLARRERAVAEAAENVVVRHAAELTGEYLDRLRELGKRRARLLGSKT